MKFSNSPGRQTPPLNWRNILWLFGSLVATLVLVPIALWQWGITAAGMALFVLSIIIAPLCITAGYHRLFSHRSYEASALVRFFYLLFGSAAFQGSVLEWSSDHRSHHRAVDTDGDPYNIRRGFFFAHMGWLFRQVPSERFPLDLWNDPLARWQHQLYVPLAIGMGLILPFGLGTLFGNAWGGFIYGGLLRVVIGQHCTFLINSLSHTLGSRPFNLRNSARDNLLMAFLAYGEGYHNFHHRFQTDYRNGFRWYHWDPTKWLIQAFSFVGLAGNLKRVPHVVIETTRLQTAQQALADKGIVAERLSSIRQRAMDAQNKWRTVYAEYRAFRKSVTERSRVRKVELRTELKLARIEFKSACRQWYAYARAARVIRLQTI